MVVGYRKGLRMRRKIVNLGRGLEKCGRRDASRHDLRRDAAATSLDGLQKTEGVDAVEAHGFETFPERCDGRASELVGGLFGNPHGGSDFAVAPAVANAFDDNAEPRRQRAHGLGEALAGFKGGRRMIGQRHIAGWNPLHARFRRSGGKGGWKVEIVNVVPVMTHLAVVQVQVAQGIAHGPGRVGDEIAFGRIEKPRRMGECLLGGQLDLGMWQPGDVVVLPGDVRRERKELFHPFFHDGNNLAGHMVARQAQRWPATI